MSQARFRLLASVACWSLLQSSVHRDADVCDGELGRTSMLTELMRLRFCSKPRWQGILRSLRPPAPRA